MFASIRNFTVERLQANSTITAPIYNSKVTPTMTAALPAVIVYLDNIQGTNSANVPTFYYELELQIDVLVSAASSWADTADDLVETILSTLMTDSSWTGMFTEIINVSVGYNFANDGQKPIATAGIKIKAGVFKAY